MDKQEIEKKHTYYTFISRYIWDENMVEYHLISKAKKILGLDWMHKMLWDLVSKLMTFDEKKLYEKSRKINVDIEYSKKYATYGSCFLNFIQEGIKLIDTYVNKKLEYFKESDDMHRRIDIQNISTQVTERNGDKLVMYQNKDITKDLYNWKLYDRPQLLSEFEEHYEPMYQVESEYCKDEKKCGACFKCIWDNLDNATPLRVANDVSLFDVSEICQDNTSETLL